MMMHLHDESVNLIQLVVTALKRRGMGDGTPGEQGAGEGGKREQKLRRHSFFFSFFYYCLSSSLKSEPSKVN